jgi:hypothetical protein
MEFAEARAQITLNPPIIKTVPEACLKFPLHDIHATILAASGPRHWVPDLMYNFKADRKQPALWAFML